MKASPVSGTEANNSLNNVAPGTYNLYLYGVNGAAGNHDRGTSFTVWTDPGSPTNTLSTLSIVAGFNQYIEGNDYVIFSNLVVGSGATIHYSYTANPKANNGNANGIPNNPPNTEADFNGVQLVRVMPSPARPIAITALLSGSASIQYAASDTSYLSDLIIAGASNTFSGQWNVSQGTLLGSGANCLGTNIITVGTNGAVETLYDVNNTNGILFLNGPMFLHQNDTFGSVALNGVFMTAGAYTAAELTAMNSNIFPATWTEQAGSTYSNSSGSLTVITIPPPVFTQNPSPLTVYQGQTAQFTATAVGTRGALFPLAGQQREPH